MAIDKSGLIKLAVKLSPTGILAVDRNGIILLVNAELESLFSYSRDEFAESPIEILLPVRLQFTHPNFLTECFKNTSALQMGNGHLFGRRKDGSEVPVEIGLNPVKVGDKSVVLATVVDVTTCNQADARFQAPVESSPSRMIMTNAAGTILLVNREVETLFKYSRNELIDKPVEHLIPKKFRHSHPDLRNGFFSDPNAQPMGSGLG